MFFKRSSPLVLVSGAGPVGLMAALSLVRRGVSIEIVEEGWRGSTHSYAVALHPGSLELLEEFDLLDPVLAMARRLDRVGIYAGAERVAQLDLGALPGRFGYLAVLPQSRLEQLLVESLAGRGVQVHYNQRVASIDPKDDRVELEVDVLDKVSSGYAVGHTEWAVDKTRRLSPKLVLGADGYGSLIRQRLDIPFDRVGPPEEYAVFEFDAEGSLPDELSVVVDERTSSMLWPLPGGRYRFSFGLEGKHAPVDSRRKDHLPRDMARPGVEALDEGRLRELVAERAPWFAGALGEVHWRTLVRFQPGLARRFGAGRVWLAGDAGHVAGPVAAQSVNVGLREARQLSEIYADVLADDASTSELEAYGRQRRDEWQRLLGTSEVEVRATPSAAPAIRPYAARLASCIPASGADFDQLLAQLGLEWARPSAA